MAPVPYLGLELTMHVIKRQIRLETVPLIQYSIFVCPSQDEESGILKNRWFPYAVLIH